jgi:hypothetical protein
MAAAQAPHVNERRRRDRSVSDVSMAQAHPQPALPALQQHEMEPPGVGAAAPASDTVACVSLGCTATFQTKRSGPDALAQFRKHYHDAHRQAKVFVAASALPFRHRQCPRCFSIQLLLKNEKDLHKHG